ncbi:hypothetical protein ASPVEDRAFT_363621 [Aspergillus versicolor CBS 583.65]|uniref:Uncharacterized protein n=1 Tax=Aspergillus versicolor CBS 583.65 TaxID=1036611 RepID=A0A1L9Q0J4_ASPVE|nr:uncharacterized protein ASPVEDRAFT_363621 [Aspergillus versicolor CBS 583.65]OJJ07294.1 hypothetical protein ASPVEDRAFT_363621 [Aspergillus versicolor CBS 583.65]
MMSAKAHMGLYPLLSVLMQSLAPSLKTKFPLRKVINTSAQSRLRDQIPFLEGHYQVQLSFLQTKFPFQVIIGSALQPRDQTPFLERYH